MYVEAEAHNHCQHNRAKDAVMSVSNGNCMLSCVYEWIGTTILMDRGRNKSVAGESVDVEASNVGLRQRLA